MALNQGIEEDDIAYS